MRLEIEKNIYSIFSLCFDTGYCCTFNYVRSSEYQDKPIESFKPAGIGHDMGLTVLLNLTQADYFYPIRNFIGAVVMIFDGDDFPESSTGELTEVPVDRFSEVRITLNVETMIAEEQVQRYSIEKRQCMFKSDMKDEFNGDYYYGGCMLKCKVRSILALCNCKMFNLPTNFADIAALKDAPFCSLSNIACLNKYRIKWATFRPRETIAVFSREMEDSLNCVQCYPMCSASKYSVDSTSAKLNFYYKNRGSIM